MTCRAVLASLSALAAVVLTLGPVAAQERSATVPLAVHTETMPIMPVRHTGTIDGADWTIFKTRFIRDDGKLVDSFSKLSHSEGQGYAMLLALAANDQATFDRVWTWTRTNLKRSDDALLAWKWQPDDKGGGAVEDHNDATDADILVAWALHRAAKQWQVAAYDDAARPIARDILGKLVRDINGFAVLLPGHDGFAHDDAITINLSYWIFPAFLSLNEIVPSLKWYELQRSGLYLLSVARFGRDGLPSDWMDLRPTKEGGLEISLHKDAPIYGFDAMRIPLYLLWDGKISAQTMAPFLQFWRETPDKIPATVNLATGEVSTYPISPGARAIVTAVETRSSMPQQRIGSMLIPTLPSLNQDQDYYSAALGLLLRLALNETS